MPIKFRKRRNLERGTEIGYATIPLKDVDSDRINEDVADALSSVSRYDKKNKRENDRLVKELRYFALSNEDETNIEIRTPDSSDWFYLSLRKKGNKILVRPAPFVHTIYRASSDNRQTFSSATQRFESVLSILNSGFKTSERGKRDSNVYIKQSGKHRMNSDYADMGGNLKGKGICEGDIYSLELFKDEGKPRGSIEYSLHYASPKRISSVNIELSESASPEEKEEKMKFYQKEVNEKYHVPVRFFIGTGDKNHPHKRIYPKRRNLEQAVSASAGFFGLLGSILFSSSITGNVIGLSITSNMVGVILFIVGLAGSFIYFRLRK